MQEGSKSMSVAKVSADKNFEAMNREGRQLVYNGSISLKVDRDQKDQVIAKIVAHVKAEKGYISRQSLFSLTVRVPSKKFKESFEFVRGLAEVSYENINVEDITDNYVDTKIRLDNSEKLQKRLVQLLKQSKSVEETIKVEKELSRITERIEILRGKMRLYQNQIDFSTLSVSLQVPSKTKPGPLGYVFVGLYKGIMWLFVWQ